MVVVTITVAAGLLAACAGQVASVQPASSPSAPEPGGAGEVGIILGTQATFKNGETSPPAPSATATLSAFRASEASDGKPRWSTSVDGPAGGLVAADGILYAGVVPATATSSPHTRILALHLADGTRAWQRDAGVRRYPLAAGYGAVYVITITSDTRPAQLQALRASDGDPLWTTLLPGVPSGDPRDGALLDRGTLYLALARQPVWGGALLAIRASDGARLWSVLSAGRLVSPVLSNGVVYAEVVYAEGVGRVDRWVGPFTGTLIRTSIAAWRAADGMPLWRYDLGATTGPEALDGIAVSGDTVYADLNTITSALHDPAPLPSGQVVALDARTGKQRWRVDTGGEARGLAATGSAVYAGSLTTDPQSPRTLATTLHAYSPHDGTQLWARPVPHSLLVGDLEVHAGGVYFQVIINAATPQRTFAVDAVRTTNGSLQRTYPTDGVLSGWLVTTAS